MTLSNLTSAEIMRAGWLTVAKGTLTRGRKRGRKSLAFPRRWARKVVCVCTALQKVFWHRYACACCTHVPRCALPNSVREGRSEYKTSSHWRTQPRLPGSKRQDENVGEWRIIPFRSVPTDGKRPLRFFLVKCFICYIWRWIYILILSFFIVKICFKSMIFVLRA